MESKYLEDRNRPEPTVRVLPPNKYSVDEAASDWQPGHRLDNGRYEVDGLIGVGGMGKVYLAHSVGNPTYKFAVKRTKQLDDFSRRAFLAELQTWIDLPRHPHIVGCRFFRTENDEVLIFAEYVDGGSLDAWIRETKERSVEQILDYAIQFAWGLHQAHELGLVHQDVKPGNALITKDGIVKVCDFGLSRARSFSGEESGEQSNPKYSNRGCTPLYRSPEQARGDALTKQTDIWSWGVSVFEMFTGNAIWERGEEAGETLARYIDSIDTKNNLLARKEVTSVLRQCLHTDPNARQMTILDAAKVLIASNSKYARLPPAFIRAEERKKLATDLPNIYRGWMPGILVLANAVKAAEWTDSGARLVLEQATPSQNGQAVAEFVAYDIAGRIYYELIASGRYELGETLARVLDDKVLLHHHVQDFPGALAESDRAITIYERLVNQEGRSELARTLASAYGRKGDTLARLGNLAGAISEIDSAIAIYERLVNEEGRSELADGLASEYGSKGIKLNQLGNLSGAIAEIDRAIAIYERLVSEKRIVCWCDALATLYVNKACILIRIGNLYDAVAQADHAIKIDSSLVDELGWRSEDAKSLAFAYQTRGLALRQCGNLNVAVVEYDRAIRIYERLVNERGCDEFADELAVAYIRMGVALVNQGNLSRAIIEYSRAIEIYERLVNEGGREDLVTELTGSYINQGNALQRQGNFSGAIIEYDSAIEILERSVNQKRSEDLAVELASAYMNRGVALQKQGNLSYAVAEIARAIEIRAKLVNEAGRSELSNDLATAYLNKGNALADQGNLAGAVLEYDQAIAMYERLVNEAGRSELANNLATVYMNRAILWQSHGESGKARQDADRAIAAVNAPENQSTAAAREKIVERVRKIKDDTSGRGISTMNPAALPEVNRLYGTRSSEDANRAAERNIAYQKARKEWEALPFYKRWRTPKPSDA